MVKNWSRCESKFILHFRKQSPTLLMLLGFYQILNIICILYIYLFKKNTIDCENIHKIKKKLKTEQK